MGRRPLMPLVGSLYPLLLLMKIEPLVRDEMLVHFHRHHHHRYRSLRIRRVNLSHLLLLLPDVRRFVSVRIEC
jgi:hypothetical protein